jgi:multiple sugar transport system permease protein
MASTTIFRTTPRRNARRMLGYLGRYLFILFALLFFLFPLYWIISMAFRTGNEIFSSPPVFFPSDWTLAQFRESVQNKSIFSLLNSLIVTTGATLLALALGVPAAYSLARFNTGGRNFSFWILSQRFLPPIAIIIPIFLLFRTLKWIDTYHGLILLYAMFNLPYVIWMMRSYFKDVPVEVEESALVDGASRLRVLWTIVLPLSVGGLIATGIFTFVFVWNEFLFALVLTRTNAVTLPVAMANFFGTQATLWGQAGVLSMAAMAPIFVLTFIVQRYLVRGLTLGAIK